MTITIDKLEQKIHNEHILFFDMDGTLIDTNYANYLSYKKAIQKVTHTNIAYNPNERFDRELLKKMIPNIIETEYERIIQEKERYYKDYLPKTKLNKLIADILIKYSKTNKTVLVTNCREDRTLMILKYHEIIDKFSHILYRQKTNNEKMVNKYKKALSNLKISPNLVILFENENSEIKNAITAGILEKNIIKKTDFNS